MDIIPIMCSLMKSLCIYNRKQLEDLWKHCCKYSTMQKCVDEALGFESELDSVPLRVLIVTFSCQQGALHWLQETMCPYDMLLDSHKKLYNAFGLGRSLFAVWNIHSMFCYAERILAGGQTLPKSYSLVKEDLHQLGGDFALDQTGKVIMRHSLRRSWDRPTANEIVKALK
uniref:uncharacterized protein isoform X3 n=1 Tax=Myxine glutinosa TaxID=7769 RepID=UPI00358F6BD1